MASGQPRFPGPHEARRYRRRALQLLLPAPPGALAPRGIESLREEITQLSREHSELRGAPPIHVYIQFSSHGSLEAARRLDLSRQISRACHAHIPELGGTTELERRPLGDPFLPPEVDAIHIYRPASIQRHHSSCAEAGMVLEDSRHLLQKAIARKAKRLPEYLRSCSQCWLLLVADSTAPSSFIEADPETQAHGFSSPFDRTFFLSFTGNLSVLELRTRHPGASGAAQHL